MNFETINYGVTHQVARIALNRPESLNAFDTRMRLELLSAIETAVGDDAVRVLVITGEGRAFCAGADLAEPERDDQTVEERLNEEYKPFLVAIEQSPKPVIASVRGAAAGIGSALMMACDLVVMSETGFLFQAFSNIGLIPDGGSTWHLSRALGPKRAYEMMMTGERFAASKCLEFGLANKVVPDGELEQETMALAQDMASRAPLSARYTKQAIRDGMTMSVSDVISLEARLQNIPKESADHAEGKAAFFAKRKPVWTGR